ncbi:rhomboid family intramembrane serine protease [candidate division KSB1 bacterium]|nr:rhomboid family intramembrane serine protease [candidate division KSB1 bacterium]
MIPIKDDNPTQQFPFVTATLIAVNVIVFGHQLFLSGPEAQVFIERYGAVPALLIRGQHLWSVLTSMFLHGGLLHLLGNMLYLWIFGDNIEQICGRLRFVFFYLLCGVFAFLSHFIFDPTSSIPMVGASGAISGVLGAYALRFPRARVHVFIWFFFIFYDIIRIPAVFVLGFWFFMQLFSGFTTTPGQGGVAWFAHVGGFIAGLLFIRYFEKNRYRISY